MSLTFNRTLIPDAVHPERLSSDDQKSRMNIVVVFTSVGATLAALKKAGNWARCLHAQITLVVPQVVPYPLQLDCPPTLLEFQQQRFRQIAAGSPVDIRVQLYLCRDSLKTLETVLRPHSLVVIGGRKRFWPTPEKSLARKLLRAGYEVMFTETE